MIEIFATDAPRLYYESLTKMRISHVREESRNGPVYTIQEPVLLTLTHPDQRVITDPIRDCNPFFHVMEFIWMMAGSNDAVWLSQFNKNYINYSDDKKTVHAAYGHRWRQHFDFCQIEAAVGLLKKNPQDRRVVIGMWAPWDDLGAAVRDVPCNTQIMCRVVEGALNFLVTNRSNDLIWGALGANIVHMTMLQELMAAAAGLKLGAYRVITNNLHVYPNMPRFQEIWESYPTHNVYHDVDPYPLLQGKETLEDFLKDCELMLTTMTGYTMLPTSFRTKWMIEVGQPMYDLWFNRELGVENIKADDWRISCQLWLSRRGFHG